MPMCDILFTQRQQTANKSFNSSSSSAHVQASNLLHSSSPPIQAQDVRKGIRPDQAHEAVRRPGRHRRQEGGHQGRVRQAAVGLPQEEQPPGLYPLRSHS